MGEFTLFSFPICWLWAYPLKMNPERVVLSLRLISLLVDYFSRWYHPPSSHCFGYLSICTVMSCIWITWISVMSCIWITWISVMSCIWITWISVMSCIWITWISVLTWINCFVLVYNVYMPHMWSFLVRYMQS